MIINKKKSLGQNFIFDKNILNKISSFIESTSDHIIIEIGPGLGTLTSYLFKKNYKKLILIEKDNRLIINLNEKFNSKNTEIVNGDALNYNYSNSNFKKTIITGNLPFNISVELLYRWVSVEKWPPSYTSMYLMFQKEVANRIMAKPNTKSYGKLSVVIQSRFKVSKLIDVAASVFTPVPKVDAVVLKFTSHNDFDLRNIKKINLVTTAAFSQRRKMIRTTLKKYSTIMNELNINQTLRPEDLCVNDYCEIANLI